MPMADSSAGRVHRPCCRSNTMASAPCSTISSAMTGAPKVVHMAPTQPPAFSLAITGFSMSGLAFALRPALHQRVGRQLLVEQLLCLLRARHRQIALVDEADLRQHRRLIPVDVLVIDLVAA